MNGYEDLEEFEFFYPKKAQELARECGEGDWINEPLYFFESLADYGEYEFNKGHFAGAYPELLLDYDGWEGFGKELCSQWEMLWCYKFDDDSCIKTTHGF